MMRNITSHGTCKFIKNGCTRDWAPEVCANAPVDEKIDLFTFGGLLYKILTGKSTHFKMSSEEAIEAIKAGLPPYISKSKFSRDDPANAVIIDAISKCQALDPRKRPSARELAQWLTKEYAKLTGNKRETGTNSTDVRDNIRLRRRLEFYNRTQYGETR